MSAIRIYKEDEPEYKLLQDFCSYLNGHTTDRYRFYLKNILFDAGQNWWYTAVISEDMACEKDSILRTWQTCTPTCYNMVLKGQDYFAAAATDIFEVKSYTNPPKSVYDLSCVDECFGGSLVINDRESESFEPELELE